MKGPAVVAAIVCVLSGGAASAGIVSEDPAGLLDAARDLFDRANDLRFEDPDTARRLYASAGDHFERIARDHNVANGKLLYDLANARFLSGDIGRAILNYRRAALYIPRDANLRNNLDHARRQRIDTIDVPSSTGAAGPLLFWHYDLSVSTRATLFAVFYVLIWIFAAWRLVGGRNEAGWGVWTCAIISLLLAGSLAAESIEGLGPRQGVLLADRVIARSGDSQAYRPAFDSPLHAGTEFALITRRAGWIEIQLPDGRRCWVPAATAELIVGDD